VLPDALHDVNTRGIFGHIDVTNAGYSHSAGHYDPGPNFPWDHFLVRVNEILHPAPPIDWAALVRLDNWRKRVYARPLRFGDRNRDVAILVDILRQDHYLAAGVVGDAYGKVLQRGVYHFKLANRAKVGNTVGTAFGGKAADVLLSLG
jgi:hypothetical protein